MSAASPSSLPPPAPPSLAPASADDALARAFAGSDVLVPPPPEEGAIPEWHLATGVKPLRPLPRDLADTVRHRRPRESPPRRATPRPRAHEATERLPRARKPWLPRFAVMMASAVAVGAAVGVLAEHVVRHLGGH